MANMAMASTAPATASVGSSGSNPFYFASNYYIQKNNQQIPSAALTTSPSAFNLAVDSIGFLRGFRLQVRSSGAVGGAVTPDNPWNLFQNLSFNNVDGGNILFPMTGYEHMLYQAYGRPWQGNPTASYDYAQSINPSFTLKLAPEVRHTVGALDNTDARSQYQVQGNLAAQSTLTSGTISTAPTVTVTSYVDIWAQPDTVDLRDVPNEQTPPGANIQTKRRKLPLTLNAAGADNQLIPVGLMSNQLRLIMVALRDSNGARQDYFTDPIQWTLDARKFANYNPDTVQQYMEDFYGTGAMPRPTGVYVFPRFYNPGTEVGQGWLQTNSASRMVFESTTAAAATNLPGTATVYVDEIVPAGPFPVELMDL